ncbi:hypothetical protein ACUM5Y_15140 [Marinomonas dokdonensis]|uniref:hypothetical protein n=1 Tax=Marinomonas dokdonensis TaxID=328224 RepID=UPI00405567BE
MSSNEDIKVGFQDSSATIADISESSTVAMVDVGQLQPKKIEAPTERCLSLHLATIAYLNASVVKSLSKNSRLNIYRAIKLFFCFLYSFKADEEVSFDCLNGFIQNQRKNSKAGHTTIYQQLHLLKTCLKWCFSTNNQLSDHTKSLCRQYYIYAPSVQAPEKVPIPPLSRLFAECPYNDTQLLDSLKKLCIWIINHEAHFRREALQLDGIRQLIEGIGRRNIGESPISFASFDFKNASQGEARVLYGAIITEVRNSNNLILKERLVVDIRHPFEENALTEKQLNWVLDRSLLTATDGEPARCRKEYQTTQSNKKKSYMIGAFKCFSIRSLLVPTDIECFAMQCLLAGEKMNASSIQNLIIDDVVETPKGIQFQFQKKRRPINDQVNMTALHPLGSTIGKTYRQYVGAMKLASDHYNTSDEIKLLSYLVKGANYAQFGFRRFSNASNRYLELLTTEKTHLRHKLLQDFEDKAYELEPIFWLLGKIAEQNKKVTVQEAVFAKAYRTNKSLKRDLFVTEKAIGLNVEFIRQSAIISEDAKSLNSLHLFNDINVTAQLANHSPSVHNQIYIDRSTAKEKVENDRLFVSRIGALMERDAELMGDLIKETSVLDYNQALEILGLPRADESAQDRISKRIDELGIDTDLMDSFQTNGKKIFLANKMSVALIIKYLEHIRANFDDVLNDDSSRLTKATLAARDYFYFSAILQKFSKEVREQGERYADTLPFSYAKLSDITGASTND